MKRNTVFFDLDGTLTESGPGIMQSVRYALARFGIDEPNDEPLRRFIGPPLMYSFRTFYGLSADDAMRAMHVYREYYEANGMFQNSVYDGIPALLDALKTAGKRLCVATGKPEKFAVPILRHYGLAHFFDVIGGSDEAETRADKTTVIRFVLNASGAVANDTIMIGDRHHDVDGAHANGIPCIGVLYGYGDRAELEDARADAIAATVSELQPLLLS